MITTLTAYIGRDNEDRLELLQDGVLVAASAVTKAVLKFGTFCLDTEVDTDEIYFLTSDNQTLCLKIGIVTNLVAGAYSDGKITLFDAVNTNGLAWADLRISVKDWAVCPVVP